MMSLVPVLLFASCAATDTETAEPEPEFCSDATFDGATLEEEGGDANPGSGTLKVRVITDQSDDVNDPYYVAYRTYALEPARTGGVQTIGTTSGDGLVEKTLGAGIWDFEASWTRGSRTCLAVNEEITVREGKITQACVVLTCPQD